MTTDPHILAGVNIECADDMYTIFYIDISELISDRCEYTGCAQETDVFEINITPLIFV